MILRNTKSTWHSLQHKSIIVSVHRCDLSSSLLFTGSNEARVIGTTLCWSNLWYQTVSCFLLCLFHLSCILCNKWRSSAFSSGLKRAFVRLGTPGRSYLSAPSLTALNFSPSFLYLSIFSHLNCSLLLHLPLSLLLPVCFCLQCDWKSTPIREGHGEVHWGWREQLKVRMIFIYCIFI